MSILGIDFGKKRIGLAISEGNIAKPLSILTLRNKRTTLEKLAAVITTNRVDKIIFGLPSPDTIGAKKFANELVRLTRVPLEFRDETLSTQIALEKIRQFRGGGGKEKMDSVAAAVLLQEVVDEKND